MKFLCTPILNIRYVIIDCEKQCQSKMAATCNGIDIDKCNAYIVLTIDISKLHSIDYILSYSSCLHFLLMWFRVSSMFYDICICNWGQSTYVNLFLTLFWTLVWSEFYCMCKLCCSLICLPVSH